jgi:hypothetical protein
MYVYLLNEKQLDAQFIFSVFWQTPQLVWGLSIAHHQEVQHTMYLLMMGYRYAPNM